MIAFLTIIGFSIPLTDEEQNSLYFANNQKDYLLINTPSPRIIFIGGSNLSFGLNSKLIKDSLKLNPINLGVHACIGLEYMIDNTEKYIKKSDIVILAPEYSHFFGDFMYGDMELLESVYLTNFLNIFKLSENQIKKISKHILNYSFSRIFNLVKSIFNTNKKKYDGIYNVSSFNIYGDTYAHWKMNKIEYNSFEEINTPYNNNTIKKIVEFEKEINKKGANLFVTYPGFQDISYKESINQINKVENELRKTKLILLGSSIDYKMSDSLTFNTPYHLNKIGVDYRTQLFISDFKKKDFSDHGHLNTNGANKLEENIDIDF